MMWWLSLTTHTLPSPCAPRLLHHLATTSLALQVRLARQQLQLQQLRLQEQLVWQQNLVMQSQLAELGPQPPAAPQARQGGRHTAPRCRRWPNGLPQPRRRHQRCPPAGAGPRSPRPLRAAAARRGHLSAPLPGLTMMLMLMNMAMIMMLINDDADEDGGGDDDDCDDADL